MSRSDPLLRTLVRRASFGATVDLEAQARDLGWESFLETQLDPSRIDDSRLDAILARYPQLPRSAREIRDAFDGPALRLVEVALWRAIFSRRQLFERVVEVWNDHFAIDQGVGECRILKTVEDRAAIRAHALGRFEDLLAAVTRSAAMLEYLDNRANVAAAPNENFARELLELHTIGVGEFDERDVREVARCFTGFTMRPFKHAEYGEFVFDPTTHDDGPKVVLGRAIPAGGGESDGARVLSMLATHPATARRIALELLIAFVSDAPDAHHVDEVADVFTASDGDLRAVVRAALSRPSLARSKPLFQRPFRFVVSLVRACEARVERVEGLAAELANLGHVPFAWPAPDGYPTQRSWWESGLLARWRFVEALLDGRVDGVRVDVEALLRDAAPKEVARRADALLEGGKLEPRELAAISARATDAAASRTRVLALVACAPSAQEH